MPRYLFLSLLLLLLMSCALCSTTSAKSEVELFKRRRFNSLKPNGIGHDSHFVDWLSYPSLVFVNDVMVVKIVAVDGYKYSYILTKYISTGGDGWAERAIYGGENWTEQWAFESPISHPAVSASAAKNDTIYGLHASDFGRPHSERQWEFVLSIGKVAHSDDGKISIVWKNKTVEEASIKVIQPKLKNVRLVYGSGFVMEDGTFVFIFTGDRGSSRFSIIGYSKDPSTNLMFHFDDKAAPYCYPNYFTWEEKLFMFPSLCGDDARNYKLRESDDMGKTWRESSEWLAWTLNGRLLTDITSIKIGEKRLLLFFQLQEKEAENTYDAYLFVAYNNRMKSLGNIFTFSKGFSLGSLFYTKDELFYLDVGHGSSRNIMLFRLRDQMEDIKKLLEDTSSDSASEHGRGIMNGNSVYLYINVAVVLLCVLFGMWAPIAS